MSLCIIIHQKIFTNNYYLELHIGGGGMMARPRLFSREHWSPVAPPAPPQISQWLSHCAEPSISHFNVPWPADGPLHATSVRARLRQLRGPSWHGLLCWGLRDGPVPLQQQQQQQQQQRYHHHQQHLPVPHPVRVLPPVCPCWWRAPALGDSSTMQ